MALSEYDQKQLNQSLAAARAAEADENAYDATPHYREVLRLDPDNREAAFFLYVYEAGGFTRTEFGEACQEAADKLTAAAEALAQENDPAALFAPMARRTLDLADKYIRALDYQEEHFASSVGRDVMLNKQRNDRLRQSCLRLLNTLEQTAAGIPGAEQAVTDARKAQLKLMVDHSDFQEPRDFRAETRRLQAALGKGEVDLQTSKTLLRRLGRRKMLMAGVLLVLSLIAIMVYYLLESSRQVQELNEKAGETLYAVSYGPIAMVMLIYTGFFALLYFAVQSAETGNKSRALMFSGIYTGVNVLFLLLNIPQLIAGTPIDYLTPSMGSVIAVAAGAGALLLAWKGPLPYDPFSWFFLAHIVVVIVHAATQLSKPGIAERIMLPFLAQGLLCLFFDLACAVLFCSFGKAPAKKAKKKEAQ